jgi:flagellar motor protein MotB
MDFYGRFDAGRRVNGGKLLLIALAGLVLSVGGTGCKKSPPPPAPSPAKSVQPDASGQDPNQTPKQDNVAIGDLGDALSSPPAATPQGGADQSQSADATPGDNSASPDGGENKDGANQQMQGLMAKLKAFQNSPIGKQLASAQQKQDASNLQKATTLGPLPAWPGVADRKIYTAPILQTPGLMVITAVQKDDGDYESSKTVDQVTPQGVHLQIVTSVRKIRSARMVDAADLNAGAGYAGLFFAGGDEHRPGSTAIGLSTQGLNRLRAGQTFPFHLRTEMDESMHGKGKYPESNAGSQPVSVDYSGETMYACTLKRVEANDVAVPVLLNDQPVELAALHAVCLGPDEEDHFWFLDQPAFPLTLAFRIGIERQGLQTIKIITPKSADSTMEAKLAAREPVDVYGIYFDFNQSTIKPESKAVLTEIAGVMKQHPDWKLSVSGHTDNVGGAAPNLALSQRRAEAVKNTLVSQYGVQANRLSTAGYGLSQPVATNDTLEGRARNRRVELRQ